LEVAKAVKSKKISCPVYLGVGQEHIAVCLSKLCPNYAVFPQHRCHSYGLSFGIPPEELARQIIYGMEGSASIGDSSRKIFGHSGLLGDQVPIACGYAFSGPTIVVLGDAAAEEDYVLASLGFAVTHKLPILFVCEDNNLSILTEKSVRRSWDLVDVAKGFGLNAKTIEDNPEDILNIEISLPMLVQIKTERHLWHCGTGQDSPPRKDVLIKLRELYGDDIEKEEIDKMEKIWLSL
jgi:pyruvate dehydrogenase E1 component alpha subunit